jgi:uncharacterized protein YdeI (YjbR/CyaY-like superfamily)
MPSEFSRNKRSSGKARSQAAGATPEVTSLKTLRAVDPEAWRTWLKKHHTSETEIWLLFPKNHTGLPAVSYDHALDEALCYGWIDSIIRRIDDDWYARKFTPRTNCTNWSELNRKRVAKLVQEGRMTPAGISKIANADVPAPTQQRRLDASMPPFFEQALERNSRARANFDRLAPSYRRAYIMWVTQAKREETRLRRLSEAVQLLAANKKLGLK